jgi:4,5-DOPA dioxygenase extradiol
MSLPALFISHGSPMLLIEDSAARDFLSGYARSLPKPRAIVIASAHFETGRPAVVGDAMPGMIYDFGGACRSCASLSIQRPAIPWLR